MPVAISTEFSSLFWCPGLGSPYFPSCLLQFSLPHSLTTVSKRGQQLNDLRSHLQPPQTLKSLTSLTTEENSHILFLIGEPHGFLLAVEETLTPQIIIRHGTWRVWHSLRSCWYFRVQVHPVTDGSSRQVIEMGERIPLFLSIQTAPDNKFLVLLEEVFGFVQPGHPTRLFSWKLVNDTKAVCFAFSLLARLKRTLSFLKALPHHPPPFFFFF